MPQVVNAYQRRIARAAIHGGPHISLPRKSADSTDSQPDVSAPGPRLRTVPKVALLIASGIVALAILDVPLARADLHSALPKWTIHLVTHAETFGNGYGVALILLSLVVLESRKRTAARLALSAYGAGLAANVVKLCVERARPYYWLETSDPSLGSQFGGWFTLGGVGSHWQSFPSAHTATAVGLAYGLSKLYPCGRRWFTVLAAMVAVQRVVADMHYASDTLFAAAIALLFAAPLYGNGRLAKKFDAWEAASQASQVPLVETRRAA